MSRWSRPGLLALVGCLVLVVALTVATPDPAMDYRRRWDDVGVGEWGRLENATVRVTSVRLTGSVVKSYGDPLVSDATFVVVAVEARVTRAHVFFSDVTLSTRDGRQYEARQDTISSELSATDPGFTRVATEVFEVPDDRVAGAVLQVDHDAAAFDVYSRAVRVDLGLGPDTPRLPGPLKVTDATVRVTP
ncbi:hypothetical protein [uncultured Friedmanniella sp.]|uniref:hypothetical protein n=1 Tax=uncultured Friedmanniella sp. TaxID=335381 RepID=UPI0035CA75BB